MKIQTLILITLIVLGISGCNSKKRSEEIKNYTYDEITPAQNDQSKGKVGNWIQEGTVCYGLVTIENANGKVLHGFPVKAKVMTIKSDSLKMKTLETLNLSEVMSCAKMKLSKGETWWETQGELFKTKEEAEAYLKKKGWLKQVTTTN